MSAQRFPHIAQRLFNRPLAILPGKAELVMAAMAERFGIQSFVRADGSVRAFDQSGFDAGDPAHMLPAEVLNRVAVIPIEGTLVNKLGTMQPYSGMTGYDGIRANLDLALRDPRVDAVVLDIDSPGGEVAGCFDLADAIYASRGQKPIWAVLSEDAYSAAYAIASAADRIVVPRTGGVGSIGIIAMHTDISKALSYRGLTVTLITYGAHKADGHPSRPLDDATLAGIQSEIDACGDLFVSLVARNRGMSFAAVRATQADTFMGERGVAVGLADAVMPPDQAFAALLAHLA